MGQSTEHAASAHANSYRNKCLGYLCACVGVVHRRRTPSKLPWRVDAAAYNLLRGINRDNSEGTLSLHFVTISRDQPGLLFDQSSSLSSSASSSHSKKGAIASFTSRKPGTKNKACKKTEKTLKTWGPFQRWVARRGHATASCDAGSRGTPARGHRGEARGGGCSATTCRICDPVQDGPSDSSRSSLYLFSA